MRPIDHPGLLRSAAVRGAMARLGADAAVFHGAARGADVVLRLHGVDALGPAPLVAAWRAFEGRVVAVQPVGLVELVMAFDSFEAWAPAQHRCEVWQSFEPFGLHDALQTCVAGGDAMLGTVHLLRLTAGPWVLPAAERRAAAACIGEAFRAAFEAERALAVPAGTLVVSAEGGIRGDPAAEAWLERAGGAEYVRGVAGASLGAKGAVGQQAARARRWAPAGFLLPQPLPDGRCVVALEPVVPGRFPEVVMVLTPSQLKVATLAASGLTNAEVAAALGVGAETVRTHLAAIYDRLGIASRFELVARIHDALL